MPGQPAPIGPTPAELALAESLYANLRDARDRLDVTIESGPNRNTERTSLVVLIADYNRSRRVLLDRLAALDSSRFSGADARALGIMRRTLTTDLDSMARPADGGEPRQPSCGYDPAEIARLANGLDSLRKRVYTCYGWAQSHIPYHADTTDRLSLLSALGRIGDSSMRQAIFLALEPVWRSVNGGNEPASPYRQLLALIAKERKPSESPSIVQAAASGVPPDSLEPWLLSMLEAWRSGSGDSLVEPWDWFYQNGRAARRLGERIPRDRLLQINREVYRSLGADVQELNIHYDVEPREGKTPVAYTTFGARPRLINGRWRPGQPWIFATYRSGGLDNLNELLHETGHAIHIAAIRARPAFADWPDSDPFTEALADFVALEVYEPAWQQHWLGDSAPLADGLRARYGGIVLDVAWALFELRMQRDPAGDPNQVWTALTRDYLRIRPHPELSWWAMRGQLVDAPGYMMNYAVGAMLIAAIRARTRELHGSFTPRDSTWYGWIAPRLFRFGLARPSREVIEQFLGGPVSPAAILADMKRPV